MLSIAEISALYASKGGRMYSGEPVTQLEHALQTAWRAERAGASDALVAASLLHDIGHMVNDLGETPTEQGVSPRDLVDPWAATWRQAFDRFGLSLIHI